MIPRRLTSANSSSNDKPFRETDGDDPHNLELLPKLVQDGKSGTVRDGKPRAGGGMTVQQPGLVPVARGTLRPYILASKPRVGQPNTYLRWNMSCGRWVRRALSAEPGIADAMESTCASGNPTIHSIMATYVRVGVPFDGDKGVDADVSTESTAFPQHDRFIRKPPKKRTINEKIISHSRPRRKTFFRNWIGTPDKGQ